MVLSTYSRGGVRGGSSSSEPSSGPAKNLPKQEKPGENGTWVNERFVRNYKGTNRPFDMDPEQWNSLDKERKHIVKDEFLKYGKSSPTDVDVANAALCRH